MILVAKSVRSAIDNKAFIVGKLRDITLSPVFSFFVLLYLALPTGYTAFDGYQDNKNLLLYSFLLAAKLAKYLSFLLCLFAVCLNVKSVKNRILSLPLLFFWIIVSDTLNGNFPRNSILNFVGYVPAAVYLFMILQEKSRRKKTIYMLHGMLFAAVSLNLLFYIFSTDIFSQAIGLERLSATFFGLHESTTVYSGLLISLSIVVYVYNKNKIVFVVSTGLAFLSVFLSGTVSGTGSMLLLLVLLLAVYFFKNFYLLRLLVSPRIAIVLIFIFNLLLVVFRVQEYFASFISGSLNRSVTMSGRTLLWDGALRLFYKNPIIGNGMNIDTLMSNLVFGKGYTNAHNCFLQLAIISGLVGISLFFIMFFLLSKPLSENKYDAKCAMFSCCILASAFCGTFYIDMLSIRFFAMLVIGYFLPQIIKDVKGSYTFVEKTSAIDSTKYIKK